MKRESVTHVLATGRQGNPEFFGSLERLLEGDPEKGSVVMVGPHRETGRRRTYSPCPNCSLLMCGRNKFFAERSGLCGRLDVSEEGTGRAHGRP